MKTERNMNLDLLRILCMVMVVAIHTLGWGGLVEKTLVPGTANYFLCNVLLAFCLLAVNCFVMISGYFLCTSKFKLQKLLQIWGTAFFYSVSIYLILCLSGNTAFSLKELIKCAMIFTLDRYWFITAYLLLYMVFPFLNCAIRAMNQKMHLICCAALLFIFSFLHNLVYICDFGDVAGGYSFLWFCVLYMVASYFRLYVPERIKLQKWTFPGYAISALIICGERFAAYYITPYIFGDVKLTSLFYSYNSIVMVAATLCLFQFFRGITVKGKSAVRAISTVAPLTLAVYLIHEQDWFRPILWNWLHPGAFFDKPWLIAYVLLCIVLVFSLSCGIEWLRQWLTHLCKVSVLLDRICVRALSCADKMINRILHGKTDSHIS